MCVCVVETSWTYKYGRNQDPRPPPSAPAWSLPVKEEFADDELATAVRVLEAEALGVGTRVRLIGDGHGTIQQIDGGR